MRWIWLDRIVELEQAKRCVAVKNISLAEDVLHDHFPARDGEPARPVMPNSLIIEGMAQTAGILVGHARDFAEKVILAKITRATFTAYGRPGFTLRHTAEIQRLTEAGASTTGSVELIDPVTGDAEPLARIDLMFSHVDKSRAPADLPEHNFVFDGQILSLLHVSGVSVPSAPKPV